MSLVRNLVIGSEGFVGRPFCAWLEARGETVIRYDVRRHASEDARQGPLDLSDVDRVYVLAWDVGGAKYLYREDVQLRQMEWNVGLLHNLMPQLGAAGVPFLFVSSQLAEDVDTVYGVTKRLGEVWTEQLGGTRVRLWNVYGPVEERTERSHVVSDFVMQAVTGGRITMLTDGTEERHFIHIDDVCRGLHTAMDRRIRSVCDITSFEWVSVRSVAEMVGEIAGAEVVPGPRPGRTPHTPIAGKIEGWWPAVGLREGLRQMIERAIAISGDRSDPPAGQGDRASHTVS